ncbi:MAG: type II toxin-antitoxin system RelE/ParE family toxin [Verrucomicrobia bacterium]|nr:type II toxin-antitoxin system RelE/ParE family toxin [Verrucomicrobiota bacterium]
MNWGYELTPEAVRNLRDLGPAADRVIRDWLDQRIRGARDPRQFGKPLRGSRHGLWRYRVRDWRLLCRLEDRVLIVIVVAVGHRSTVYDG